MIAVIAAVSCAQNEIEPQDKYGYLTVGISEDVSPNISVKSGTESDEIVYRLDVIDSKGNVDFTTADHRTVDAPIELLMDKYTVKASNGTAETCFNTPYWCGENTVNIYAERDARVALTCKMRKVKFSVHFPEDEEFKSMFKSYELEVKAGNDVLTFSSESESVDHITIGDFRDTAYFAVPSDKILTYTLKMKNNQNSFYFTTNTIEKVSEAQHYHFDFKMGEREEIEGALVLNVTLNGTYSEVHSHNLLLNFDRFEMPSYSHNPEFDPDADGIVYPLGNDITKKLTFTAPRKIKSLVISHLDENLLTEGLPQVLEFVNITSERDQIAQELGITTPTPVTPESVTAEIDITEFVKKLPISPENTSYQMSFTVIDSHDRYARCDFEFTIVSDIQAETVSVFPWSGFSILKGRFFSRTAPEGVTFQYKKKDASDWIEIAKELMDVDLSTLTFSYRLNHLDLNTEYVFRATSDKDKADGKTAAEIEFKTFATEKVLNNMSLDLWYNEGDAWYPNASSSSADWVWDTANGGTKALSLYPTNPESTILAVPGEGKRAAKMVSQYKMKFAAGNIYTGKFAEVNLAQMGAELDWGVPFDSRPLALKGYFRYEPAIVTEDVGAGYEFMKDQPDICQIQAFLTDWTGPFRVKAYQSGSVFVDFTADYILAHGEILSNENTTGKEGNINGYIPFVIPLEYRTLTQPTYIVVAAAASRYGDYFTGGRGSTLYLDELEFIYDPDQLTDEQFETVMKNIY